MAAQLKADSTQSFCEGTLGWHRKRWMVCFTDIGLAGLISGENYALWLALFGSRPGASYELMLLDCTLLSDLQTWLLKAREYNPKTFKIGTPSELQQTLLALWAANVPSSARIIEDLCRLMRWLLAIVCGFACGRCPQPLPLRP